MACFTVPLAEALVITAVKKIVESKKINASAEEPRKKPFSIKESIGTLQKMLYGGSALLAVEHIYHGEIVPFPPFLSAMSSPESTHEMLHEMATVGVGMAVLVTAVWGIATLAKSVQKKNQPATAR